MGRRKIIKAASSLPSQPQQRTQYNQFAELGVSGVKQWGGQIFEDILKDLQGVRRYKKLREFRENNEVAGALFFVIEQLIRKVDNRIVPFDETIPEDVILAEFIADILFEDMDESWNQHVVQAADNFLSYGFAFHEICYKARGGDVDDPVQHSKFADNKIGVRRLALRPPETLFRWHMNNTGDVFAFEQMGPPDYITHIIPSEKAVHYIFRGGKSSPEGKPLLRSAYPSWVYLTGIKASEAIGISRQAEGIPIAWVPPSIITNEEEAIKFEVFKNLVTNIGMNEQRGIVYPLAYDTNGHKQYDLTLLSSTGTNRLDFSSSIERYQHDIALTIVGQWIFFGLQRVGTQALAASMTDIFGYGVEAMLDEIQEAINVSLIPKILRLNGFSVDRMPKLKHGKVNKADLTSLGTLLQSLAGSGYDVAGQAPDMIGWIGSQIGFPLKEQQDLTEE